MLRMRRKTDKDIRREYRWLVIGSVILILLGLLFAILPNVVPPVSYDSLQTKEVTITAFKRHIGGRRGHTYDYILTSEGEKFNLSGDYQRAHLNTLLTEGTTAIIDGVETYNGARVSSPDLRAGAALVIAGLQADGFTVIDDIGYILRGYEDFDGKLRSLGAEIRKVHSEKEIEKFEYSVG
jgi:hypothetical protein